MESSNFASFDVLDSEHRTIEKLLDSFVESLKNSFADPLFSFSAPFSTLLSDFIKAFKIFDEIHHKKEENLLFSLMNKHGFDYDEGPLAVMLYDHAECRKMVEQLEEISKNPGKSTTHQLLEIATNYAQYLKNHINKEDNILYPMAKAHIPPNEWAEYNVMFSKTVDELEKSGLMREFEKLYHNMSVKLQHIKL